MTNGQVSRNFLFALAAGLLPGGVSAQETQLKDAQLVAPAEVQIETREAAAVRDKARDVRFIYKVSSEEAKSIRVGDAVLWNGQKIGTVKNVHAPADAPAYISVWIDEKAFGKAKENLTPEQLGESPNISANSVVLRTRVTRSEARPANETAPKTVTDAKPPIISEETRAEIRENWQDAKRETAEVADDVAKWSSETFDKAAAWTAEASENSDEKLAAFGDWADDAGEDVKRYAKAGWEETKDAYDSAVNNLSEELASLDSWTADRNLRADLKQKAENLRERIELMRNRLKSMKQESSVQARESARKLLADSRELSRDLIAAGESEKAENLEAAASELRVQLARADDRRSTSEQAPSEPSAPPAEKK